jgi:hypothetical protein
MRVIVAGSRGIDCYDTVEAIEMCAWDITCVISGMCEGSPDMHAVNWAVEHGIDYDPYPADWDQLGKRAGFVRNKQMADDSAADACLIVWDGESKGSLHMYDLAKAAQLDTMLVAPSSMQKEW